MEFIKELREIKVQMFKDRVFMYIPLNNGYLMSVQGSSLHSCTPKKTLKPTEYKKMEVTFYDDKNVNFTRVEDVVKEKSILKVFEGKREGDGWYGNIPVKTIDRIYKKYREK